MIEQEERGVVSGPASSGLAADREVRRITKLTDRIEDLQKVTRIGRTMRWFLPAFVVLGFGTTGILDVGEGFFFKALLIIGVALGYSESVTWWYSRKIKELEREIQEPALPAP